MKFSIHFDNISTGAVADTFKTMAALIAGDVAGRRCRLLALQVGPADDTPADINLSLKLSRVDDVSMGGAGTGTAQTPSKKDSGSAAADITAKVNCSAEPTIYGTVSLWQIDMNRRNSIIKEWLPEDAPIINQDQLLGLLIAPRTAAAATVSGSLEFEQF